MNLPFFFKYFRQTHKRSNDMEMKEDNLPSFLIIGSMKSGTTVLYDFINLHKDVVSASKKEIHYFSLYPYKGLDWYKSHFGHLNGKIVGEASPTYFDIANTAAIPNSIKVLLPNIKLILIIRDPIERAVSHFIHLCSVNKIEVLRNMSIDDFFKNSFANALRGTTQVDMYLNHVLSFSCYYRKVMHYLKTFDRNQLLILTNDQLRNNPQETMDGVFDFMNIKPFQSSKFMQFKYSSGSRVGMLSKDNIAKLSNYLYPDYQSFCYKTGLKYNPKY